MDSPSESFLFRLKKRKIVEWALAYLGVAWMLLQVVDVVGDKFLLSLALQRGLIVLLAFGFFMTLVVAWYHGEKGRQKLSGGELLIIGALTVIAGSALRAVTGDSDTGDPTAPEADTSRPDGAVDVPVEADARSVAVLPFRDLSPDGDQEYLAEGFAEELLVALSRVGDLKVVPRTSSFAFRDSAMDARTIGRRLGVSRILEGSVRRQGDTLRVAANLVDVQDGFNAWSEAFDRRASGIFDVQEEIAAAIVEAFQIEVGGAVAGVLGQTDSHEAQDFFLRGRHAWNRRDPEGLATAVEMFREALALDPAYARAYVGLADAYAVQGFWDYRPPAEVFPLASAAAETALEIEPRLAEPHATLGYVALYHDWDWEEAEAAFRRSLELDSSYPVAHQWYANYLVAMGRFSEASTRARASSALDPLSMIAHVVIGWVDYYAGNYEAAVRSLEESVQRDPTFLLGFWVLGLSLAELGRHEESIAALERSVDDSGRGVLHVSALAYAMARAGREAEARELLGELEDPGQGQYVSPYELAGPYAALGQLDRAAELLRQAHRERSHSMAFLRVDPKLTALEDHPGFRALLRDMALLPG